ncbi:thioesterase II family protein [Streptomyces chumphonensis]|uniref:thioesterase II family protein n=1 Tax=Streptomyces chumphonensis TaxID=1214925 RepID=UPI003D72D603
MTVGTSALRDASERWVLRPVESERGSAPLLRLVCVPYAGGGAAAFHGWSRELLPAVEPWTLRLPGRDARRREPLPTDLVAVARDAARALAALLTPPFALFGHSLGAFLAFETARALRDTWGMEPALLAVSARNAPQEPTYRGTIHQLPDEEYLEVLDRRYGAIPPIIREDAGMRALYLPILRADTALLETYRYVEGPPLSCPIAAYGGTEDPESSHASLARWGRQTTAGCTTSLLPGGHFFLQTQRARLLESLREEALRALVP